MADFITAQTDSAISAFAAAMAQALHQLDSHGHVTVEEAARLRRVIAETPKNTA